MSAPVVGIIGGTGLGEVLLAQGGSQTIRVETPFGMPSSDIICANWEGVDVAFLSRHGPGHIFQPSIVPYRANIYSLKKVGVKAILASGATGSLREQIAPRDLVIVDQVIDKTYRRVGTFFDVPGLVVHTAFADPFCESLRQHLLAVAKDSNTKVHPKGTYVCMEGPAFSTRAESELHRQWGADLIGMTCLPEARLAREAELCYAMISLPTDYDCWRPMPPGGHDELIAEIISNLKHATNNAIDLMKLALKHWKQRTVSCHCQQAIAKAIWSDKSALPRDARQRLGLLLDNYLPAS